MSEKKEYKVVVWRHDLHRLGEDIEDIKITVRDFKSNSPCPTCNQPIGNPFKAAYQDGQAFGEMLVEAGSSEYGKGLREVLQESDKFN